MVIIYSGGGVTIIEGMNKDIKPTTVRLPCDLKKEWGKWLIDTDMKIQDFHTLVVKWAIKLTKEEFMKIVTEK